jgi:hypothetical protein
VTVAIGVDIGQAVDPTAIVVVETYRDEPEHVDDKPEKQHQIRWLEKVALGTSYLQVVERIAVVAERCHLLGSSMLVVDATGVGRPVVDMLRKRTTTPLRAVTFTGGDREKKTDAYSSRVPKRDLVTALEVVLQSRRLHVVPDCPLQEDLAAELQAFEVNLNARGHDTYDGASGKHDDLVSALMLALHHAERGGVGAGFAEAWRSMAARP